MDTECVCGDAGGQDTARVAVALCDGRPAIRGENRKAASDSLLVCVLSLWGS